MIIVVSSWLLLFLNYSELPEIIPTHYNASGEIDGVGEKSSLIHLPTVATIIYIVLTLLARYPHLFNYSPEITEENAVRQYTIASAMVRYLKCSIVLIFFLIMFKTIQSIEGSSEGLGQWFLPLVLGLVFVPILYFLVKSGRANVGSIEEDRH